MKPEITYVTQYWSVTNKRWIDDEPFKKFAPVVAVLKQNRKGYPENVWRALEVRTTRKVLDL